MYRLTKSGKALVDAKTKLPLYTVPVNLRIKRLKSLLYEGNKPTSDDRWNSICSHVKRLDSQPV